MPSIPFVSSNNLEDLGRGLKAHLIAVRLGDIFPHVQ